MWLDSSKDYDFIHETRSGLGESFLGTDRGCNPCFYRRAMRDERKTGRTEHPEEKQTTQQRQLPDNPRAKKTAPAKITRGAGLQNRKPDSDSDGEEKFHFKVYVGDGDSIRSGFSWASCSLITQRRNRDKKSGFLDKPLSQVMVKLRWPHMYQNPRYVTEALTFNQLSFPQFVGGECRTILRTTEGEELQGRLRVLSKIAYLYDQCKNWEKARAAYFTIISSIKEGEATWSSTFGHYNVMCPPVLPSHENEQGKQSVPRQRGVRKAMARKDYFCKIPKR